MEATSGERRPPGTGKVEEDSGSRERRRERANGGKKTRRSPEEEKKIGGEGRVGKGEGKKKRVKFDSIQEEAHSEETTGRNKESTKRRRKAKGENQEIQIFEELSSIQQKRDLAENDSVESVISGMEGQESAEHASS